MADLSKFLNSSSPILGGNAAGQVVAVGFADSASRVRFYIPLNGNRVPVSLSITSTFDILDSNLNVISANVSPIIGVDATSKSMLRINVSGLSGLTIGENYLLGTGTASSEITINY